MEDNIIGFNFRLSSTPLSWRTEHEVLMRILNGIQLNGPKLGRPSKDKKEHLEQRRLEKQEAGLRNAVEAKFGEGKRCYGMGRIMAHLKETSETVIGLQFIIMNLGKRLRDLLCLFWETAFFGVGSFVYCLKTENMGTVQ